MSLRSGRGSGVHELPPGRESGAQSGSAVEVAHLRKTYGTTVAVDDVSFSVPEGEIFGILGPNGAGKTTTVECVVGLRVPDAGQIRVLGLDPLVDRSKLHSVVGVQLQASSLPGYLKVGEIMELFHSFYREPANLDETIEALGLTDKRSHYYRSLSGGLKQRLAVALALIGNPKVAVLDEMTTGLDPQARRDTWEVVERVRDGGVTIILVTHYMDEAERLCDRVALVDQGRVVALDTPETLASRAGAEKRIRFVASMPFDDHLLTVLPEVSALHHEGDHVVVTGSGELANAVILALATVGVSANDLQLDSANLEDAFVQLTGRHLHDDTRLASAS